MTFFSVSIPQQLCVPNVQRLRATAIVLSLALTVLACGGAEQQSPISPSTSSDASSGGGASPQTTVTLSGTVRGGDDPLADAAVELDGPNRFSARTDADGAYRFSQVPRGEYMLRASREGYETAEQRVTLDADASQDLSLPPAAATPPAPTPSPTPNPTPPAPTPNPTPPAPSPSPARYRLYGLVHDNIGSSIIGARVELVSGPDAGAAMVVQYPAVYEFRNLRAGVYVVRASRGGYQTREVQQSLAADTELKIDLGPVSLSPQVGGFEGLVFDRTNGQKLDAVRVEGLSGVGAGRVTTSNEAGVFWFELPPGATRFRWSKDGYVSHEQEVRSSAGATTQINVFLEKFVPPPPPLFTPPYTVTGTVSDSRGNPVSGADVSIYGQQSPIDHRYGFGRTDSAGRFSITSPERRPTGIKVAKDGYVTKDVQGGSTPPSSTWTVNITIPRIERYVLVSPTSVKVGQSSKVEGQVTLDDGSRTTGVTGLTSSNEAVAVALSGVWVWGKAPGTATITGFYFGVSSTLQVRVVP